MPPSEPPKGTKSRGKRRRSQAQPPSSTARQGAAFGSRPARPLPKPRPAPRPSTPRVAQPRAGTTPAPVRVVTKAARAQKPTPAKPPTARQVRNARVQRAQHVSQGRQVSKAASLAVPRGGGGGNFDISAPNNKPAADRAAAALSKKIGHKVYRGEDGHYYAHVKRTALPDRHIPIDPFTGKKDMPYIRRGGANKQEQAAVQAPALKVLAQTTRPAHAIAAGEVAAIKGKNVPKAALRGLKLKDKSLGSDVLKAAGVKNKGVAAAGGFALDVLQDPLTYVTGGTGSVAEKAAASAARKIERKAVKAGMSEQGAKTVAARAAKIATAKAPAGRGVTVKAAGRELPGVRRATAAGARGVRKATRTVVGPKRAQRIAGATRNVTRTFAPRMKAVGATHEQTFAGRAASREARALRGQVATKADIIERELGRHLKPSEGPALIRAREKGDLQSFIAPTKKAREKLKKENPKEFARKSRVVALAHDAFRTADELYQRRTRAGAAPKQTTREFVTNADAKKLDRTIAAEQAQQRRALVSAGRRETQAREPAVVAEAVGQVRHAGRVAVSREKGISQARQALGRAKRDLRVEMAKPVSRRRGVPVLEARVRQARQTYEQARRPVTQHLAEKPAVTGLRAGKAAQRYERKAADVQLAQRKLEAAQAVPTRSMQETPEAFLRRVHQHAVKHDLPLLKRRAETLLAKKPAERTRAYFPRETQSHLESRLRNTSLLDRLASSDPVTGAAGQARTVGPTRSGFKRIDQRPLHVVNPERIARGEEPFSTDVPLAIANHLREAAKATSEGEFAQSVAKSVGRPVKSAADVKDGEDLYHLGFSGGKFGLHKVANVQKRPTKGGQYVALPRNFFENMQGSLRGTNTLSQDAVVALYDRLQGGWKRLAITNVAFHVRNMLGDIQAGYYLPGPGGSLGNIPSALKATRRASEIGRYVRAPTAAEQSKWAKAVRRPNEAATVKVAGKKMNLDQFVKQAIDNGVLDSGVIAREVRNIGGLEAEQTGVRAARTRVGRAGQAGKRTVDRWVTNRENVMRLAAFKQGLDRGMTPREAADMANFFHIDYGELSGFEREVIRRVAPFYTWTARSLPVAGVTMIQRPGKFANLEKAREEIGAGTTGQTEDQTQANMPAVVKRAVPVVLRVGGSNYAVSASLPVTLLNEFPASTDIGKYLDEMGHFGFGLVGPLGGGKIATELYMNKDFFRRADISDPKRAGGYVPAPAWLGKAPDWFKHAVKATQIIDKASGKKVWAWPGRVDYASHQFPGAFQQASSAAAGARAGQEKLPEAVAIASPATGVRVDKLGKVAATREEQGRLRNELAKLNERASLLNAQGIRSDNATPEYKALRKRINEINKTLYPRAKKGRRRATGPLPLGGGTGGKLPLGGGSSAKLPLG